MKKKWNIRRLRSRVEPNILQPSGVGTVILLVFLVFASMISPEGEGMSAALRIQAMLVGCGLTLSLGCDYLAGLRNLVRVDLVSLWALYFLTFVEFLFPQPDFHIGASGYPITGSARITLLALAGLAIGRHLPLSGDSGGKRSDPRRFGTLSAVHWLWVLAVAAAFGYLHMLMAVNFNPLAMIEAMMQPRFSQPWGRGKFGDWKALIFELSMFLYMIPPVYGILLAKRKHLSAAGFAFATGIALLTLFYGFSSGTRNIFVVYVAGMIGGYLLVLPRIRMSHLVTAAVVGGTLLYVSTVQMLAFRQIGLQNYLEYGAPETHHEEEAGFFVDANLLNMAMVMDAFPARHDHLGFNVPYNALVRPIPRAIWPGKPEGLEVGIEEAVGMEGLTLAVTFAGEAYMAAGDLGVIVAGLFFGALCGIWNHLFRGRWNPYSQLLYASGFFPAAITMRSLFSFTTALLPILGLLVLSYLVREFLGSGARRRSRPPVRNEALDSR